jgi:hypothetical protein
VLVEGRCPDPDGVGNPTHGQGLGTISLEEGSASCNDLVGARRQGTHRAIFTEWLG